MIINMKKNLKNYVEQSVGGEAACLLDMNDYGWIESCGLHPDLRHKKTAHISAGWQFGTTARARLPLALQDLTAYRFLTFSAFSVEGAGGTFALRFESDAEAGGEGGYACLLPITHNGWNDYRVELPFLQAQKNVEGWDHVSAVVLDCVVGGQSNRADTVLYLDSFYVWENEAPAIYEKMPELKGAAVFSRTGIYSIVDRKRVGNSLDGDPEAKPFEKNGALWLPLAPVAAILAHTTVADNRALTLSFTYRRKKYQFSAASDNYQIDGETRPLGFYPLTRAGMLFFPAEFVRDFFHWRQTFTDPQGLIILSNRKAIFDRVNEAPVLWRLNAELTLTQPTGNEVRDDLHRKIPNPDRGRLLLTHDEWMALRHAVKEDEGLKAQLRALRAEFGTQSAHYRSAPVADTLAETSSERLAQFRTAEKRIEAFSALFRITGEKQYAERTAGEMESLAALPDWDADSMLNVSVAGLAMAIGYDWCHTAWTEARKAKLERAMLRNAMRPGVEAYLGKRRMWRTGSAVSAQINAGMTALALALADVYPETSLKLLNACLRNNEESFAAYSPDGGFAEGIEAWEKSARSLVLFLAMLKSACGKTYGFESLPGFAATPYYAIAAETKNGAWNYHNNAARPVDTATFPWFTAQYGDPVPAARRAAQINAGEKPLDVFDLIFHPQAANATAGILPLDAVYRKAGLAMLRSGWGDGAWFLGLHGGSNREVGGELDAGSFLLESQGERFFCETGGIGTLPVLLRRRAEGQNTIVIDPTDGNLPDQNPGACAAFTEVRSAPDRAYAVVDMTGTNDAILRGKRGAMLTENRSVAVIQDEITLAHPGVAVWTAYTSATVLSAGARTLVLEKNGKQLLCKLCGAGGARFEVRAVEDSNLTRVRVTVQVEEKLRIAVACKAFCEGENKNQSVYLTRPISTWALD